MCTPCPYVLSENPVIRMLQQRWLADRERRRRRPPERSWRGCLGLAMLLERPDNTEYCGERALIPNDHVTWLAMRDVPPGHFPGRGPMHRRGVSYVNTAKATLRFGLPSIDLSHPDPHAVDFRFFPGARRREVQRPELRRSHAVGDVLDAEKRTGELAALVQLSEAMTQTAFAGRRARRGSSPRPMSEWMPVPYLAFGRFATRRLLGLLVQRPPAALRDAFCDAAIAGVRLVARSDFTYLGPAEAKMNNGEQGYIFREDAGGKLQLRVPRPAELLVRPGEAVHAGRPWCRLLSDSRSHRSGRRVSRWKALVDGWTDRTTLQRAMSAWIAGAVAAHLPSRPDLTFLPAELVATGVGEVPPEELWWDLTPVATHLEGTCATFPPLPLRAWADLRLHLPGDVDLKAGIGDPRLEAAVLASGTFDPQPAALRLHDLPRRQLPLAG